MGCDKIVIALEAGMFLAIAIAVITCGGIIAAILIKPQIGRRIKLDTYWMIALLGAILTVLFGCVSPAKAWEAMTADTAINPFKILVLFLSMTVLSVFLDEMGFFRYLAGVTLKRAGGSQKKLFLYLYVIVSVLTVFTSNDIIILSFTPFICYFARSAKISPVPYLAAEFVGANTWSMALIIGNPTNIYLATTYGIGFAEYAAKMFLPTVAAGVVAFFMLFLVYRKELALPMHASGELFRIEDKFSLVVGLFHLGICTVLLAVGSYFSLPMWLVALFAVISLIIWNLGIAIRRKRPPRVLAKCLMRAPWVLIPFVLSMFVVILGLNEQGVTQAISDFFGTEGTVLKYGTTSFLVANVINNIPMSVFYCSIAEPLAGEALTAAVYATVIGSNLGALLTPIGALAGIMWSNILKQFSLKFGYLDFLKIGVTVAVPALAASLGVLYLL